MVMSLMDTFLSILCIALFISISGIFLTMFGFFDKENGQKRFKIVQKIIMTLIVIALLFALFAMIIKYFM